jgi:hypothetical protein
VAGSQASSVHGFPSSHAAVVPTHWPAWQASPFVQLSWSSHAVPSGGAPTIWHAPLTQASMLQSPGLVSQLPSTFVETHPWVASQRQDWQVVLAGQSESSPEWRQACSSGSQTSVVQAWPSSQSRGAPPQLPSLQVSPTVQKFPSSHGPATFVRTQAPVAGSQVSSVQALPSSQPTGTAEQAPVAGSHASVVQAFPSSQTVAVPWQTMVPSVETAQASSDVQELPSSHAVPGSAGVPRHRPVSLQVSSAVQEFPSSHVVPGASVCPTQPPPPSHTSSTVQEFPSSHRVPASSGTCRQPPAFGSLEQLSEVHGLASSQLNASCRQVPVAVSQESTVQGL